MDWAMSGSANAPLRHRRGQAMVEFAIALPVIMLLAVGGIELGRGYAAGVAVSDAARDGARLAGGKTAAGNGPGTAAMCSLITADLASLVPAASVTCPRIVGHPAPFFSPADYPALAGGRVTVVFYCGTSGNCQGVGGRLYQTQIDVGVFFGFNDVNLLGGAITIPGYSRATTTW
jgi:hypothetical protein